MQKFKILFKNMVRQFQLEEYKLEQKMITVMDVVLNFKSTLDDIAWTNLELTKW